MMTIRTKLNLTCLAAAFIAIGTLTWDISAAAEEDVIYIKENNSLETEEGKLFQFSFEKDYTDSMNADYGYIDYGSRLFIEGVSGYAASFDGSYDYIDYSMIYQFPLDWTVNTWIMTDSYYGNYFFVTDYLKLGMDTKNPFAVINKDTYKSPHSLESNIWHMITYVHDSKSNKLSIYVDGIFQTSFKCDNCSLNENPLCIGNSGKFNGVLDELTAWERVFSEEEIASLYQSFEVAK